MIFPEKPKNKRLIYLDHAATTYVDEEVKAAMEPFFSDKFANPSAIYSLGRETKSTLDDVRQNVAENLHALPDNIIFCSGGTEADNLAVFGTAQQHQEQGKHIITSKIEHPAILHSCQELEKQGFEVTYLDVDEQGFVSAQQVKEALRKDTILLSLIYANNEVGTVQPLAEIGRELLKWRKEQGINYPYFHTDACQAAGALDLDVERLHLDLMTINASKMYGPKGAAVLYKRRGVEIKPLLYGGSQEMKLRAGTENLAGIVGLAKALALAQKEKEAESKRLCELRDYLWEQIQAQIPKVQLNGSRLRSSGCAGQAESGNFRRLPNNLNVSILGVEGEALLLYLNEYGIICSTGSACASESLDPSHVLTACGLSPECAHGSLRFSLGKRNNKEDIDYVMKYLPSIVEKLREISPINLKIKDEK